LIDNWRLNVMILFIGYWSDVYVLLLLYYFIEALFPQGSYEQA